MSAHNDKLFANLRAGCTVTLRTWRGDSIGGTAFLSWNGEWLVKTRAGAVYPIMSRELIAVENGAVEYFARLQEGAKVRLSDWTGCEVHGIARRMLQGQWECLEADGARWLIEPYRLIGVTT